MTGQRGIADWLTLHGLTADQCLRLIPPAGPRLTAADPPDVLPPWTDIASALVQILPGLAAPVSRLIAGATVRLGPDLPRAMTWASGAGGLPEIICPITGRLSDRLMIAHELGHAIQYLAAGTTPLPPVLRETAAFLAEDLFVAAAPRNPALSALARARRQRTVARHATGLQRALQDCAAPYHYGWNYPPAAGLAATIGPDKDLALRVLTGQTAIADIIGRQSRRA